MFHTLSISFRLVEEAGDGRSVSASSLGVLKAAMERQSWKRLAMTRPALAGPPGHPGPKSVHRVTTHCLDNDLSQCTVSCGGGSQRRDRQCLLPETRGGLECPGADSESRDCSQQNCPAFTEWSEWSGESLFTPHLTERIIVTSPACTKTCGGGQRTSQRECVVSRSGDQSLCQGDSLRTEQCSTQPCTSWTSWATWTACTKSCGTGSRRRVRECTLDYTRWAIVTLPYSLKII